MLALEINENEKRLLNECKKSDGKSLTWHLRRALQNYFTSKKILRENENKKQN
jgi:hypothetical protein